MRDFSRREVNPKNGQEIARMIDGQAKDGFDSTL
jgi:hypothetical protein